MSTDVGCLEARLVVVALIVKFIVGGDFKESSCLLWIHSLLKKLLLLSY